MPLQLIQRLPYQPGWCNAMPRKQQGWITFQASDEERQILEQYSQQTQRTKTEILRELVRGLKTTEVVEEAIAPPLNSTESPSSELEPIRIAVSARNVLRGTVQRVVMGTVNAELTLAIAPGVELVSIITRASAEKLQLQVGKGVYAVIKSNNVMIAAEYVGDPSSTVSPLPLSS